MTDPAGRGPERRKSRRRKPRGKVRVTCHAGMPGPNLARTLLDVSETGLRLLLTTAVDLEAEVFLTIQRLNHLPPVHRLGIVRWVVEREDGTSIVGIQLIDPLDKDAVSRLCRGK